MADTFGVFLNLMNGQPTQATNYFEGIFMRNKNRVTDKQLKLLYTMYSDLEINSESRESFYEKLAEKSSLFKGVYSEARRRRVSVYNLQTESSDGDMVTYLESLQRSIKRYCYILGESEGEWLDR